ncbi:MAG: helix-turn-helix transcriptional regulator [Clostridia bacterium]|nr:helix-turn-helix transcriptional regulator [Clostridia bacterium]
MSEFKLKIHFIYDYMEKNHLSKRQFCKICNISYSTLYRILNHGRLKATTLIRLVTILGITANQFLGLD